MNEKTVKGKFTIEPNTYPIQFVYSGAYDSPSNHHLHINRFYELYIFIKGSADYIVDNAIFSLKRGDIILINQYKPHSVLLKESGYYERFYMLIPIHTFDHFSFDPIKSISSCYLSLPDDRREENIKILFELQALFVHAPNPAAEFRAIGLLIQFLSNISICYQYNGAQEAASSATLPQLIKESLCYIDANLPSISRIEQIAKSLSVSFPYLSATFKKHLGTTIVTYIQTKRIALAKELLDQNHSVTDTCYECGFNDCSYFIKIFKQYTGFTPFRYAKRKEYENPSGPSIPYRKKLP